MMRKYMTIGGLLLGLLVVVAAVGAGAPSALGWDETPTGESPLYVPEGDEPEAGCLFVGCGDPRPADDGQPDEPGDPAPPQPEPPEDAFLNLQSFGVASSTPTTAELTPANIAPAPVRPDPRNFWTQR